MSHAELALTLLLFAPLAAALLILTGRFLAPRAGSTPAFLLWLIASGGALAVLAPSVLQGETILIAVGGWSAPLGIELEMRGLAWIATLTDVVIATAAWLHTRRPARLSNRYDAYFYIFFFMALFSLQGTLYTTDLFNLFIWFEVLALASFALISYHGRLTARLAAIRYLLMSSLSILAFLLGVWVLYYYTGTLSMELAGTSLARIASVEARQAVGFALACITGGILTRAALVPFHTWLPEAHAAAPYPVSALLSGFVIKAPTIALWRIFHYIEFPGLRELFVWVGAASALLGVLAAMSQSDAKKLLGYHSISQMGYILAAMGVGGGMGRAAALFFIIGHALFKSLLFLTVGELTERLGSRNVYTLRGLGRRFPLQTLLYGIAALSITGVPLFAGYTAKLAVSKALGPHPAYWLLLIAGVGTAASFLKLSRIFTGRTLTTDAPEVVPRGKGSEIAAPSTAAPEEAAVPPSGGRLALFGAMLPAAGCLVLGLFPGRSLALLQLLLSSTAPEAPVAAQLEWFSSGALLTSALVIAGGALLFLPLLSPPGRRAAAALRRGRLGINASLRLLTAGFAALVWYGAVLF